MPRRGLRCRLASLSRTREARGYLSMFLKVHFLNFRYFFIANQPGGGEFARFLYLHPRKSPGVRLGGMGTAGIDLCIKYKIRRFEQQLGRQSTTVEVTSRLF